jgi:hypothetical protein
MKNRIDEEHFCSTAGMMDCPALGDCHGIKIVGIENNCPDCHKKYPCPSEYKEEYGEEYPDDAAVYYRSITAFDYTDHKTGENVYKYTEWRVTTYSEYKRILSDYSGEVQSDFEVVCACTPWGRPEDDFETRKRHKLG